MMKCSGIRMTAVSRYLIGFIPLFKDDQINGSVVTFLDITEQLKAHHELTESREHLRSSLEGTIDAVSIGS